MWLWLLNLTPSSSFYDTQYKKFIITISTLSSHKNHQKSLYNMLCPVFDCCRFNDPEYLVDNAALLLCWPIFGNMSTLQEFFEKKWWNWSAQSRCCQWYHHWHFFQYHTTIYFFSSYGSVWSPVADSWDAIRHLWQFRESNHHKRQGYYYHSSRFTLPIRRHNQLLTFFAVQYAAKIPLDYKKGHIGESAGHQ